MNDYTYQKFKEDFEDAETPEAKQKALMTLLDSDIDVKEYKEDIQEYRAQLQDLKDQIDGVIDASINTGIENGTFTLYTCTQNIHQYTAGNNYYVSIDNIKTRYTAALIGDAPESEIPQEVKEYFNGLRDLIWIVTDNGLGTLKKKELVVGLNFHDFDFNKHFTKL
jgi:alkyl sulfatase BDS1-like metallo-beta-lactamase superfamily hydrolase